MYSQIKETLQHYGYDHLSLNDLLTLVVGPRVSDETLMALSKMDEKRLMSIEPGEIKGVGEVTAQRIRACIEVGKRVLKDYSRTKFSIIRAPEDAFQNVAHFALEEQEHFFVLLLDAKDRVIGNRVIFKGSLHASIVHPREVFKEALKVSAASIIVGHNHPSGDPRPSREDIEVTKRLVEVGKIMGIDVLDHIIVGDANKYCSFKDMRYI